MRNEPYYRFNKRTNKPELTELLYIVQPSKHCPGFSYNQQQRQKVNLDFVSSVNTLILIFYFTKLTMEYSYYILCEVSASAVIF